MTLKSSSNGSKALALLGAIAAGEAEIQDVVVELKKYGIETTGNLLAILSEELKDTQGHGDALDFSKVQEGTPHEALSAIEHRIPQVPFILNGTMYDPEDVTRFNGQELHFIASPKSDHMFTLDDRKQFTTWRQFTYLEQYLHGNHPPRAAESTSPNHGTLGPPNPMTGFNEHINFEGSWLNCPKNRGFYTLGGWNDKISSFKMVGTQVTVLHEHIHWAGDTFSRVLPYSDYPYFEERNLLLYGWNDRASSVETW
ncbi:hypothetical protein [Streptomyces aureus]|uniref:hypothetical protein n=1 Tax=Streptomyces aureus TaxID=193461 RepID=UPI00131E252A|nr:hypothetical protein [Streptomyces aureus]